MSAGLPSDEVAEDYKTSLEDLTQNSRYEISNLTVIAKENTEHAMAISRVLENHIRNTAPDRKLPALYVLDSVVKNVGTPYTLFLGRNLYQTFMIAYSLVNNTVRRKLDEMLKTWKEPVPGSLDPRPVFSADVTRPIENALIKARTAALQQQQIQQTRTQQEMGRGRPIAVNSGTWRNATPPQNQARYQAPVTPSYPLQSYPLQPYPQQNLPNGGPKPFQNGQIQNGYMQKSNLQNHPPTSSYPQYAPPQATPPPFQQTYQLPRPFVPQPQPYQNLELLHRDINELISTARTEFAANPYDTAIQKRLKALLDLQSILTSQQLPPDQIQLIRDQVNQLSIAAREPKPLTPLPISTSYITPSPATPVSAPFNAPPNQVYQTYSGAQSSTPTLASYVSQPPPAQPSAQTTDLQALLSSNKLAEIIASATKTQQPTPLPVNPTYTPQQSDRIPTPAPIQTTSTADVGGSLIASLRAAGMLPPTSGAPGGASLAQILSSHSTIPPVQSTPPAVSASLAVSGLHEIRNDVELKAASLKIPRPHLMSKLYQARPNQCSTCGKRFLLTEEDRTKKARHLDWHFKTNLRLSESTKRGQSRSWYVDELEWIKSNDGNEDGVDTATNGTGASKVLAAALAAKNDPKNQFIPVPSDSTLANAPCPICQEKFDMSWNDEVQDFVWMDAIKIGGRVYHATCHAEVKKDGGNTPQRIATPDSVLGKRKGGVSNVDAPLTKSAKVAAA